MPENNKLNYWPFVGILIIFGVILTETIKKIECKWDDDITIILSELDEIKEKLDALKSEIEDIPK